MNTRNANRPSDRPQVNPEDESKDAYFRRIAAIAREMTAEHGKDFATGAFVLAARWTAEGKMSATRRP